MEMERELSPPAVPTKKQSRRPSDGLSSVRSDGGQLSHQAEYDETSFRTRRSTAAAVNSGAQQHRPADAFTQNQVESLQKLVSQHHLEEGDDEWEPLCSSKERPKTIRKQPKQDDTMSRKSFDSVLDRSIYIGDDRSHLEDDQERLRSKLSEDTFSFLITTPISSTPFITSWMVMFTKTLIYSLILASMVSAGNMLFYFFFRTYTQTKLIVFQLQAGTRDNPLAIPAATSWPVVVCQIFAVGITVITQDDLTTSLKLIHEGYGACIFIYE